MLTPNLIKNMKQTCVKEVDNMKIVIKYDDVVILNEIDMTLGNFYRDCNIDNYVEVEDGYGLTFK